MDYSDALQVAVATDGSRVRRAAWPAGDWLTCTHGAIAIKDAEAVLLHAPDASPPFGVLGGRVFLRLSAEELELSFWMPAVDDVTMHDWELVT